MVEWFYIVDSTRRVVLPVLATDIISANDLAQEMFISTGGGIALSRHDLQYAMPDFAAAIPQGVSNE